MAYTLVYASTMVEPLDGDDLAGLLVQSRARNAELGVTGMLVCRDRSVLQLLEGDRSVVDALYRRIGEDPRHTSVTTLWSGSTQWRRFPEWSMGFEAVGEVPVAPVPGQNAQWDDLVGLATPAQRDFFARRAAALREAMVHDRGRLAILAALEGHEPETTGAADAPVLRCHSCHARGLTDAHYPCPTATRALEMIEVVNLAYAAEGPAV